MSVIYFFFSLSCAENPQLDSAALGHPGCSGHPEESGILRGHVQHLQPQAQGESQALRR